MYLSLNELRSKVTEKLCKSKNTRSKLNDYFEGFYNRNQDLDYYWIRNRPHVKINDVRWQLEKDLKKITGQNVGYMILHKDYDPNKFKIEKLSWIEVKQKLQAQKQDKEEALKEKNAIVLEEFKNKFKPIIECGQKVGILDLEFWESDNTKITEFGWLIYDFETNTKATSHFVVEEHLDLKNYYITDLRHSRNDSETLPLKEIFEIMRKEFLNEIDHLLGQGLGNDTKVLRINEFEIGMDFIELSEITQAVMNEADNVGLSRALKFFGMEPQKLHNAANDVEQIAVVLEKILETVNIWECEAA